MIFFKRDTTLPPFVPLPRFMLMSEHSINAKLLYALILNRTMLSQRSGWVDENENVYVIYTIKQMADDMNRSERTVKSALSELEAAGLIARVRQGWNRANHIFLKIPDNVQLLARPSGNLFPMEVQDASPCMGQALPTSNNKQEYTNMTQTEKGESARRRFGEYGNVYLSDKELAELRSSYPGKYMDYIDRLSAYMETSGKHYANHYATIKKWLAEDSKASGGKQYDYNTDEEEDCL